MTHLFRFILFFTTSLCFSEGQQNLTKLDWWETTLLYQLFPRSFKDSDGDGYGDLNGINEKLDYIKELGVDAIWIQPFYKSPMYDMGYDVSDFKAVDPLFGNMEDFKKLQKAVKDKGMKLILDYVPNHTSDQSEWFKLSEQRVDPYTDYYIWKDPKRFNETHTILPNNWETIFGGSIWTWSDKRNQYYLHQFAQQQPDLNYRNPKVHKEMEDVLRFWLDLGVDGFRMDAVPFLYEAAHFMDEPPHDKGYKSHIYTLSQPENLDLVKSWRHVLDEYAKKDGQPRLVAVESYSHPPKLLEYIGNETHPGSQIPFYFYLLFARPHWNTTIIDYLIHLETDIFPRSALNWVLDNHDNSRTSSRLFEESVDVWNMCILLLPGLASIYYGTELGMEDLKLRPDQQRDPLNGGNGRTDHRDSYRGRMLWDGSENAGFTAAKKPWLPVHPNYWRSNVKAQRQDPNSHLDIFKRLAALRKTPVITHGDLRTHKIGNWVYMFTRSLEEDTIAVLMNIGSETEEVCVKNVGCALPGTMFVHTPSGNSKFNIGDPVFSSLKGNRCTHMRPHSGLVLSTSAAVSVSFSVIIILMTICSKVLT